MDTTASQPRRVWNRPPLTQARLKELLSYNPETGFFHWRVNRTGSALAGTQAGRITADGYVQIGIDGARWRAHRLAWFYVHGTWPLNDIDHRNGDRKDNRLANLQDVTTRRNGQNRVEHRAGRLVGCYYYKQTRKWKAQIQVDGVGRSLGYYPTEQEAHEAYLRALEALS